MEQYVDKDSYIWLTKEGQKINKVNRKLNNYMLQTKCRTPKDQEEIVKSMIQTLDKLHNAYKDWRYRIDLMEMELDMTNSSDSDSDYDLAVFIQK